MILKRALIAVSVMVVAVFVYLGYSGYDAGRGAARSVSAASRRKPADGQISVAPPDPPASTPSGAMAPVPTAAQGVEGGGADVQTGVGSSSASSTDTIQPDPPNGMRFGGSGHYQLYRQGNLTWRLNTDTGESCVVFATEQEWRKPQVLRAGCHHRD